MNNKIANIKTDKIYLSIFMSGRCLPTQMSVTRPVGLFLSREDWSSDV